MCGCREIINSYKFVNGNVCLNYHIYSKYLFNVSAASPTPTLWRVEKKFMASKRDKLNVSLHRNRDRDL